MTDQIRRIDYFYVEVPDEPGAGARVFSKLKEARVNLLSFTAFPVASGKVQIDLVPKDPDALVGAAKAAGLKLSAAKKAFFAEGGDRVGVVADLLARAAAAGVNLRAANGCCARGGGYGIILWVRPEEYAAAAKAFGV